MSNGKESDENYRSLLQTLARVLMWFCEPPLTVENCLVSNGKESGENYRSLPQTLARVLMWFNGKNETKLDDANVGWAVPTSRPHHAK